MHQSLDDRKKTKYETERVGGMGTPSCALLFCGLVKQFAHVVLPLICENILAYNPGCDVYAHTYNLTSVSSCRNCENDCPIFVEEVYLLSSASVVAIDTLADFEHKWPNHKNWHKHHPSPERFMRFLMRGFDIVSEDICFHQVHACVPDGAILSGRHLGSTQMTVTLEKCWCRAGLQRKETTS